MSLDAQPTLRSLLGSRLFLMTSLPAVDGTLFALAARGVLTTVAGATLAGVTVIAGASAWLAAREELAGTDARAWRRFALVAAVSTTAAVAAAAAGAVVGARIDLVVFPAAAGLALLALAASVAGARVPAVKGLPLPAFVVTLGALAEVARWTL